MKKKSRFALLPVLLAAVMVCIPLYGVSAQETQQNATAVTGSAQFEEGLYYLKNKGSGMYATVDTENP